MRGNCEKWLRFAFLVLAISALPATGVHAHTPQDGIDSMAVSPDYANDHSLAIIVQNSLLMSRDRGASFKQLIAGLDNRYVLSDVEFSARYASDGTMYVSSDGDGVFRSVDRGNSWQRINGGLGTENIGLIATFALPGGRTGAVAAGSERGMFATLAGGDGWQRVVSDDLQITAVTDFEHGGRAYRVAGASNGTVLISHGDPMLWDRVAVLKDVGGITSLGVVIVRKRDPVILVGTAAEGLFRSDDLGESFVRLNATWPSRTEDCLGKPLAEPVDDLNIRSIAVDYAENGGATIFVNTWFKAVLVSGDLGETWEWRGRVLICDEQADKTPYMVPHYRNMVATDSKDNDWWLAAFDGLYRSHDSGRSWHQLETLPVFLVRGLGVSPDVDDNFSIAITTYGGGAYFSPDLGRTWSIANKGLLTTRLADIEFAPTYRDDGKVIVGEKEHLPQLEEVGDSWIESDLVYRGFRRWLAIVLRYHANLPRSVSTDLFLSDFERTQIWPMQLAFSPQYADDETIFIGHRRHGVWRSSDGGEDWDRGWEGELSFVTALAVSPGFAVDETVFAAMRGAGIYKTDDGGKEWRLANSGFRFLDKVEERASPNYVIDRPLYAAMKDVLLVVSPDFESDRTVYASSAEGLFRSDDAAENWEAVDLSTALAGAPVTALGISPDYRSDGTIIASFKGRGLGISRDKGASFTALGTNLLEKNWELRLIEFSPRYAADGVIVGATEEELLVSRDRGITWARAIRPVRYEDWRGEDRGPMEFDGNWQRELDPGFSGSSQAVATARGSRARLRFSGSSVAWVGERGPDGGQANVIIDGDLVATVDLYTENRYTVDEIFSVDDLRDGAHVIEIEVHEHKNIHSNGHRVTVDAVDIVR
jgi:photosystem II stability/assembly factor-like uncharacterized protein